MHQALYCDLKITIHLHVNGMWITIENEIFSKYIRRQRWSKLILNAKIVIKVIGDKEAKG